MKVAIVGLSPSTTDEAPWADPAWETWGLAWSADWCRFDRLFEMHDRADLEARRKPDYWDRLASFDWGPVYMQEIWGDVPTACAYPLDAVNADVFAGFPRGRWANDPQCDWYNCSIAYMQALAIHDGAEAIGIYGVDVREGTEHA